MWHVSQLHTAYERGISKVSERGFASAVRPGDVLSEAHALWSLREAQRHACQVEAADIREQTNSSCRTRGIFLDRGYSYLRMSPLATAGLEVMFKSLAAA